MQRVACYLTVLCLATTTTAIAQDLAGVIETCNGCHGNDGVSQWSDVPTIAGIDEFAHADALYIYRDEARPCEQSTFRQGDTDRAPTSMCAVTADLSDEVIDALGAHYAGLPFVAAKQDFDATLAAAGQEIHERDCGLCHSAGGSDPADEASILAGQWTGYMATTFAQYRAGERDQPAPMQKKLDALSDDDVEALLHYYASQQ
jgi:sulfide dehydrogenase cytochrome subunit